VSAVHSTMRSVMGSTLAAGLGSAVSVAWEVAPARRSRAVVAMWGTPLAPRVPGAPWPPVTGAAWGEARGCGLAGRWEIVVERGLTLRSPGRAPRDRGRPLQPWCHSHPSMAAVALRLPRPADRRWAWRGSVGQAEPRSSSTVLAFSPQWAAAGRDAAPGWRQRARWAPGRSWGRGLAPASGRSGQPGTAGERVERVLEWA